MQSNGREKKREEGLPATQTVSRLPLLPSGLRLRSPIRRQSVCEAAYTNQVKQERIGIERGIPAP